MNSFDHTPPSTRPAPACPTVAKPAKRLLGIAMVVCELLAHGRQAWAGDGDLAGGPGLTATARLAEPGVGDQRGRLDRQLLDGLGNQLGAETLFIAVVLSWRAGCCLSVEWLETIETKSADFEIGLKLRILRLTTSFFSGIQEAG